MTLTIFCSRCISYFFLVNSLASRSRLLNGKARRYPILCGRQGTRTERGPKREKSNKKQRRFSGISAGIPHINRRIIR